MSRYAIEPPRLPLSARPCPHCALPLEWSVAAQRWMEYTTGSPHWCPVARVALRTYPLPETPIAAKVLSQLFGPYGPYRDGDGADG